MINMLILVPACLITAGALAFTFYKTYKTRKILDQVEKMLDQAIKGDFHEEDFSEDRTSKIESKLSKIILDIKILL